MRIEVSKTDLRIDKFSLDEELVKQPTLFSAASSQYVQVLAERDKAKEELARKKSTAYLQLKRGYSDRGEKITETALCEEVLLDQEYSDALRTYHDLCSKTEEASALKEAFVQRAYVLKDLVQLHGFGYFMATSEKGYCVDDEVKEKRKGMLRRIKGEE